MIEISDIIQIAPANSIGTYLSLDVDCKKKKATFEEIKNKLGRNKSVSWKNRVLSNAGKVILMKSNLTCIPQYSMSSVKIPKYVCNEINTTNKNFFLE